MRRAFARSSRCQASRRRDSWPARSCPPPSACGCPSPRCLSRSCRMSSPLQARTRARRRRRACSASRAAGRCVATCTWLPAQLFPQQRPHHHSPAAYDISNSVPAQTFGPLLLCSAGARLPARHAHCLGQRRPALPVGHGRTAGGAQPADERHANAATPRSLRAGRRLWVRRRHHGPCSPEQPPSSRAPMRGMRPRRSRYRCSMNAPQVREPSGPQPVRHAADHASARVRISGT